MSELPLSDALAQSLFDRVAETEFPCVGAKAALAQGRLVCLPCRSITSSWNDIEIHLTLLHWVREYRTDKQGLRSLAVVFEGPDNLTEQQFERSLWDRVQSIADKDHWHGLDYDDRVSPDPDDPHFSLSFGGEAFFVVGLHPNASRPARRFPYPTMVFNLHDQFETLRAQGRYERMRERILERDVQYAGSINPMLSRHGEASEARQYSGRAVGKDWNCPFKDPRL